LKTIGHSLKNLGPSQATLRHSWSPKLVTGLTVNAENQLRSQCFLNRKDYLWQHFKHQGKNIAKKRKLDLILKQNQDGIF